MTLLIPYLIRTHKLCKKIDLENGVNTITQAAVTQVSINLFTFLIGFIPLIGLMFSIMK